VARLAAGDQPLAPRLELLPCELEDGPSRERLRRRLADWLDWRLRQRLAPLYRLAEAELAGPARGIVYQAVAALGTLPRAAAAAQLAALKPADRQALGRLGLQFGRASLWLPSLGRPAAVGLRRLLWCVHAGLAPPPPPPRQPSLDRDPGLPEGYYLAMGYRAVGQLAIRADALERLVKAAHQLSRQGPFAATATLGALIGCDSAALPEVLYGLGFRQQSESETASFSPRRPIRRTSAGRARPAAESPFAKLRQLRFDR